MAKRDDDDSAEGCGSGDELTPEQKGRRLLLMGGASAALGAAFGASGQAPAVLASVLGFPVSPLPGAAPLLCRVAANPATAALVANPGGPPRKLRFAYNGTGICTAAVPVALQRGYFARHNLEVEFVRFAGTTDEMLQALATDKADAGGSMLLNWLKPLEQGMDVKLTTGMHGGCTRLLVRKDAGYTELTQLKGATIGVSKISGSPRHFFAIMFSNLGINPDSDVTWREYPGDLLPTALQRGEIQALADSDPTVWLTRTRSNGELVELASNLSAEYAGLACCTLGVRSAIVREDPQAIAALTVAIQEAADHVAANPEDAAQIFSPYTPKVPVEELTAMLRSHTHNHHPAGDRLRSEIVKITSDLKRAGIIKPTTDPVKLADRVVVNVLG